MNPETIVAGVLFGLGAATLQAGSYLCSRRFLRQCSDNPALLFCVSHLQMAAVSLLALPFLAGDWSWLRARTMLYLTGTAGFYLLGQRLLFRVLRVADSSQVAPLLGLKIIILAVISALFLTEKPSFVGWLAVAAATTAGLVIAPPRRGVELQTLILTAFVCLGYAGSDLCIPLLVDSLRPLAAQPALLATCLTYLFSGVIAIGMLWRCRNTATAQVHYYALPYSMAWLAAMVCLFVCFAHVGILMGNILQATRGLISIALGLAVARLGWQHLDSIGRGRGLLRRSFGAILMTIAIIVYLRAGRSAPADAGPRYGPGGPVADNGDHGNSTAEK